jgi:GT2 family glycosyltransferase
MKKETKKEAEVKVMIAIPNLGSIHPKLDTCKLQWAIHPPANCAQLSFIQPQNIYPHDAARNFCVKEFLKSDSTHLFFLDSDVIPPLHALEKLIAADKDVVTGFYPSMRIDPNKKQFKILNVFSYGVDERGKHGLIPIVKAEGDGLIKVDRAGGGCLFIAREVLEKIGAPYFKFQYDDEGLLKYGEDIDFCKKAADAGYQLYAHTGVVCGHVKEILL